ncbi:MAG: zinc ribbon domain-containing protein [Clostridia bacterium]|nr:zinc ribbon domain-containing protein [Clostridia bacterium]
MKINCRYCGALIDSSDERCPSCGAVNTDYIRTATGQPTTIRELEDWYRARNLPPYETTRFFIGQNRSDPRCFGIYQDANGDFVVYKNKADGSRAVRYSGKDEKFAVNEFYQRLKDEISNQKDMNARKMASSYTNNSYSPRNPKRSNLNLIKFIVILVIGTQLTGLLGGCGFLIFSKIFGNKMLSNKQNFTQAYYQYDDDYYYYSNYDGWHIYNDDRKTWYTTNNVDDEFLDNYRDYMSSASEFENSFDDPYTMQEWIIDHPRPTSNYNSDSDSDSYSNDWDSGSDWDSSDSWDSGDTDWDSDW